jgi:hypothetical protein
MQDKKDPSLAEIYAKSSPKRDEVRREINIKQDPNNEYFPRYIIFEKTEPEKGLLIGLRERWREAMRKKWGATWTKRSASRSYGEFPNRMN